jgi:hypothetical protein
MKNRNPILEELHKVKDAIGRENDYDPSKLFATLRKREAERLRKETPKRPRRQRKAS